MTPSVERVPLSTGLAYEVLSWGDPASDHTVLLLHGYLDLAWGWQPLVSALPEGPRYLAPSLRGHGASDWVGQGAMYYFLDYVADVASLVNLRAGSRLSVVGHSMGGMVAAYYAGTYPERVSRLAILEGLSIPEGSGTSPERQRTSNGMRADAVARRGTQAEPGSRSFASIEQAAARMRHHDAELSAELAMELAAHGTIAVPAGYAFRHDPLLAPRTPVAFEVAIAERFWKNVTCPMLYVEGSRSSFRLSPEDRDRRVGAFAHARSVTIEGASHMMIRHNPTEVARALVPFLELS